MTSSLRHEDESAFDTTAGETIVQRFERQAQLHTNRIAVSTSSTRLSYRELNLCANRIARAVVSAVANATEDRTDATSDETPVPVALLMDKDVSLMAAILGTLKAAGLCVPLDCSYPEARTRFILEDAGAPLLVTDAANLETARRLATKCCVVLNVDELLPEEDDARNLDLAIDANAAAHLIYTSGSTGQPKGVINTHRNVLHHVRHYAQALQFRPEDNIALLTSCSVGQGMKTAFSALLNGATLCPFDLKTRGMEALAAWMIDEKITVFISVPSVFRQFARQSMERQSGEPQTNEMQLSTGNAFPDLRLVRLGGETLHRKDVELFRQCFSPPCLLANSFSSTETGNVALFFIDETTTFNGETVPVGFVADGVEVSIVDENNQEVRFDEVGEIVIRSRHLSPGYWRNPALTQQVFQAGRYANERLYRTGDLGSMSPDGCLQHRGRKDFQVKIRGFRVELGEVEAALKTHDAIRETVVIAQPDAHGENSLVAYLVAENAIEISTNELRRFLSQRVPQHAIPSFYIYLAALPQTPNGKIDRAQLPLPEKNRTQQALGDAPQDDAEKRLAQIWQKVLQISHVERHDDFFELGGNSLLAVALVVQIEKTFAQRLALSSLFEAATVSSQAELLRPRENRRTTELLWPGVVALQPKGSRPPLFFVSDIHDSLLRYRDLVRGLGDSQPVYGLQPGVDEESSTRTRDIKEMAGFYARQMIGFQPQGAYYLCGHSFAGTVAFETARQMEALGKRVAFLALLDTNCRAEPEKPDKPPTRRQRQRNHLRFLRQLDARERCVYLSHILRKQFARRQKNAASQTSQAEVRRLLAEKQQRNKAASASYRIQNYSGNLTLFREMLSLRAGQKLDLGWNLFVTGGVEVVEVSGDHDSMLEPPHVHLLTRRFQKSLQKAQQNEQTTI